MFQNTHQPVTRSAANPAQSFGRIVQSVLTFPWKVITAIGRNLLYGFGAFVNGMEQDSRPRNF